MSKNIGILGGSFNPAHEGHVYISNQAIELLRLDEVWWLISPQNPLKSKTNMASFTKRFSYAKQLSASYPNIKVSDFELVHRLIYTIDTIHKLQSEHTDNNFVWLMGADNLINFDKWHNWQEIVKIIKIAIINRNKLKQKALTSKMAKKFINNLTKDPSHFMANTPPAWIYLTIEPNPASSTKIRKNSGNWTQKPL